MNKRRIASRPVKLSLLIASWLVNLIMMALLLWVVWLSPLLGRLETETDRKTARNKHYDEAFWAQAKTIEEVWPDVVSKQRVPYYYKHLEDAAKLLDEVGIADHKARLKPYNELTRKERLFLARVIPINLDNGTSEEYAEWELVKFLKDTSYYRIYGWDTRKDDYDDAKIRRNLVETISYEFHQNRAQRNAEKLSVELRLASPVSGEIISVGSEAFSPGNAYSAGLAESRAREVTAKNPSILHYKYPSDLERDYLRYAYFRIYGETDVIAEGIYSPSRWRIDGDNPW